ncbi:MAG: hypothetical protein AAGC85_26405 [Bacteroidota bacterium]
MIQFVHINQNGLSGNWEFTIFLKVVQWYVKQLLFLSRIYIDPNTSKGDRYIPLEDISTT